MPSSKSSEFKLCPRCKEEKPGWPNEWSNGFYYSTEHRNLTLYVCGDCFDEHKAEAAVQTQASP
jgi:hypothetical protein